MMRSIPIPKLSKFLFHVFQVFFDKEAMGRNRHVMFLRAPGEMTTYIRVSRMGTDVATTAFMGLYSRMVHSSSGKQRNA